MKIRPVVSELRAVLFFNRIFQILQTWSATVISSSAVSTTKEEEKIQQKPFTPTNQHPPPIVNHLGETTGPKEPAKVAASTPPVFAAAASVDTLKTKPAVCPAAPQTPRWKSALKLILASMVLALFASAILVAVMEVRDENFRRYVDQSPAVDAFRHRYYDPSRQYVMNYIGGRR